MPPGSAPTEARIIAQAMTGTGAAEVAKMGKNLTPDRVAAGARADLVREAAKRAQGGREAFQKMQGAVSESRRLAAVDQIGVTRDASGAKKRTPAEQQRFDDADDASKLLTEVANVGYKNLKDSSGAIDTRRQKQVRDLVLEELKDKYPELAEIHDSFPQGGNEQIAFLERIINDPKFKQKSREMAARMAQKRLSTPAGVQNAATELAKAQAARDAAEANRVDAETAYKTAHAEAEDWRDTTKLGSKGNQLDDLVTNRTTNEAAMNAAKQNLELAQNRVTNLRSRIQALESAEVNLTNPTTTVTNKTSTTSGGSIMTAADIKLELTTLRSQLASAEGEVTNYTTNYNDAKSKIDAIDRMKAERDAALKEEQASATDFSTKDAARKIADAEVGNRTQQLEEAKKLREQEEIDFVEEYKSAFREITSEWVDEKAGEVAQYLDQAAAEARSRDAKAVLESAKTRWTKKKEHWWSSTIDKKKVKDDFGTLIDENGDPRKIISDCLTDTINPATGQKYSRDEIKDLLQDDAFVADTRDSLATAVVRQRLLTGKITLADAKKLTDRYPGVISKAITENKQLMQELSELAKAQGVAPANLVERISHEVRKHPNRTKALLFLGFLNPLLTLPMLLTQLGMISASVAGHSDEEQAQAALGLS